MKKLLLIVIAVFSLSSLMAQSKVAHVNSQKLLDTMPSRKLAMSNLAELEKAYYGELKEMEEDLQKVYKTYTEKADAMPPVARQVEEEKIQRKQAALQQREQEIQQDLQNKAAAMNEPILERVKKAVEIVSDRKKINYVINEEATLYFKGGMDITNEVIVELLKLDAEAMKK